MKLSKLVSRKDKYVKMSLDAYIMGDLDKSVKLHRKIHKALLQLESMGYVDGREYKKIDILPLVKN